MLRFVADASAPPWARGATARIIASSTFCAGLITAAGAMRAAPRIPMRTVSIRRTLRSPLRHLQRVGRGPDGRALANRNRDARVDRPGHFRRDVDNWVQLAAGDDDAPHATDRGE